MPTTARRRRAWRTTQSFRPGSSRNQPDRSLRLWCLLLHIRRRPRSRQKNRLLPRWTDGSGVCHTDVSRRGKCLRRDGVLVTGTSQSTADEERETYEPVLSDRRRGDVRLEPEAESVGLLLVEAHHLSRGAADAYWVRAAVSTPELTAAASTPADSVRFIEFDEERVRLLEAARTSRPTTTIASSGHSVCSATSNQRWPSRRHASRDAPADRSIRRGATRSESTVPDRTVPAAPRRDRGQCVSSTPPLNPARGTRSTSRCARAWLGLDVRRRCDDWASPGCSPLELMRVARRLARSVQERPGTDVRARRGAAPGTDRRRRPDRP